jgi:hypothetical protein
MKNQRPDWTLRPANISSRADRPAYDHSLASDSFLTLPESARQGISTRFEAVRTATTPDALEQRFGLLRSYVTALEDLKMINRHLYIAVVGEIEEVILYLHSNPFVTLNKLAPELEALPLPGSSTN